MLTHVLSSLLLIAGLAAAQGPRPSQSQARDEDQRWRVPLQQKADILVENAYANHWIEGTYVGTVQLNAVSGKTDHTVLGNNGDMHNSTWTGCYLMGAAFGYGWAKEHGTPAEVGKMLSLGGGMINGLWILSHVSGRPGMIARVILYGHGPSNEERAGLNERNEWWQGVGQYRDFRYRANPSHHNYHHVTRGVAYWYYFLNRYNPNPTGRVKAQMDSAKSLLTAIMNYGYKLRDGAVMDIDDQQSANLLRPSDRPTTTGLMTTSSLKYAAAITGDVWYRRKYDEFVRTYRYKESRDSLRAQQGRGVFPGRLLLTDFDDTEHTLGSLWLVSQLETDPELKEFYHLAATALFETKRDTKRALFNYLYAGVTGDREGARLGDALETLQHYMSNTILYPIMNSIRTDIEFSADSDREGYGNLTGRRGTRRVLPFNEIPYDNAYDWKGDPFQLDRALAREIGSLAVSGEDSMVWLLADVNGTLYRSLDGGNTFAVHDFREGAMVTSVTFAARKSRVVVLGTDRGIYWTQRGGFDYAWTRVQLGSDSNHVQRVMLDSANPNVVWAVTDEGIYRSVDLGREEVGKAWVNVTGPMPMSRDILFKGLAYGLATGRNAAMYAMLDGRSYCRAVKDSAWTMSPVDMEGYHRIPKPRQIEVSPNDPNTAFVLVAINVWGRDLSLPLRTTDGGRSFTVVGARLPAGTWASEGSGLMEGTGLALRLIDLGQIAIDPVDPRFVYAVSSSGFLRSTDGGTNWAISNAGLRIPYAYRVYAPKETPGTIFVSTPAGFHASTDRGSTWSRPVLVLNGRGVDQHERGGMGYLVAYWAGRYLGAVTDQDASKSPDQW